MISPVNSFNISKGNYWIKGFLLGLFTFSKCYKVGRWFFNDFKCIQVNFSITWHMKVIKFFHFSWKEQDEFSSFLWIQKLNTASVTARSFQTPYFTVTRTTSDVNQCSWSSSWLLSPYWFSYSQFILTFYQVDPALKNLEVLTGSFCE